MSQAKKLIYSGKQSTKGNNDNGKSKGKAKKSLSDYVYDLGSVTQASDYEETTKFILNHITKTYSYGRDMYEELVKLKKIDIDQWMPQLMAATGDDAAELARKTRQNELVFSKALERYEKRLLGYELNRTKVYSLLWEQCSLSMQRKIENRKDFQDDILMDPIALMKAIKEHSLNFQDKRYDMTIVDESLKTFVNMKQGDKEHDADYASRFRTAKEVFESHLGARPLCLSKICKKVVNDVESDTGSKPTEAEQEVILDDAYERYVAYLYITNSAEKKYKGFKKFLADQYALGNNLYPQKFEEAKDVLDNRSVETEDKEDKKDVDPEAKLVFAQMQGKCYVCGATDHKHWQCPDKNKPKLEWAVNQFSVSVEKDGEDASSGAEEPRLHWAGVQVKRSKENMKDWILLDNQSSETVFCNKKFVRNIRKSPKQLKLETIGGALTIDQVADLPDFGPVWFSPKAITNVFSKAEMADKFRICYDNDVEDVYYVHTTSKVVKFERTSNNLYVFRPEKHKKEDASCAGVQPCQDRGKKSKVKKIHSGVQKIAAQEGQPQELKCRAIDQVRRVEGKAQIPFKVNKSVTGPSEQQVNTVQRPGVIERDDDDVASTTKPQKQLGSLKVDSAWIAGVDCESERQKYDEIDVTELSVEARKDVNPSIVEESKDSKENQAARNEVQAEEELGQSLSDCTKDFESSTCMECSSERQIKKSKSIWDAEQSVVYKQKRQSLWVLLLMVFYTLFRYDFEAEQGTTKQQWTNASMEQTRGIAEETKQWLYLSNSDKNGIVESTAIRGSQHDYLDAKAEFSESGMRERGDEVDCLISSDAKFPGVIRKSEITCPWSEKYVEVKVVVYGDNENSKLMEDIKCIYVTDLLERDKCGYRYCPTTVMKAIESVFAQSRNMIANLDSSVIGQQECVGGQL